MDSDEDSERPTLEMPMISRTTAPATGSLSPDFLQHQGISTLRDIGIRMNSRKRTINTRGFGTGWLDDDKSGNYDPKLRRTPPRQAKPVRTKASRSPTRRATQQRLPVSFRRVIVLPFTSERALSYLRSIIPDPQSSRSTSNDKLSSTPSDWEIDLPFRIRRQVRRPRRYGRSTSVRIDGLTIEQLTEGHPQRRDCKACFNSGDDQCSLLEHAHEYPCAACEDAGIDCEFIISPKLKLPCERCKKRRTVCSYRRDAVIDAEKCEGCWKADVACCAGPVKGSMSSSRYDDVLRSTSNVRQVDRQFTPRLFVSCNQCRENGLRCNLKRDAPGPCGHCKKKNEECAFVLIRKSNRLSSTRGSTNLWFRTDRRLKGKAKSKSQTHDGGPSDEENTSPSRYQYQITGEAYHRGAGQGLRNLHPTSKIYSKKQAKQAEREHSRLSSSTVSPIIPEISGSTNGIQHIIIKTDFSHPIHFNYSLSPDGQSPCSWCEKPFFGLFGHGEREVDGVPYADGDGHEEVGDGQHMGHLQLGQSPTRMCEPCTSTRLCIMTCDHDIAKLDGINPDVYNPRVWNQAVAALERGDLLGGALVYGAAYCSICPTHAEFRCVATQAFDLSAHPIARGEERRGCGLLLCEDCYDLRAKIVEHLAFGGKWEERPINVLDRLVSMAAGNPHHDGIRADASFLTSTGHLMVRMEQGMGSPKEEREGWMEDRSGGGRMEEVDSEEGMDSGEKAMLERIGTGKGAWMEKTGGRRVGMPPRLRGAGGGEQDLTASGEEVINWTPVVKRKLKALPAPTLKTGEEVGEASGSGSGVEPRNMNGPGRASRASAS